MEGSPNGWIQPKFSIQKNAKLTHFGIHAVCPLRVQLDALCPDGHSQFTVVVGSDSKCVGQESETVDDGSEFLKWRQNYMHLIDTKKRKSGPI
jgi:hypothetical protein